MFGGAVFEFVKISLVFVVVYSPKGFGQQLSQKPEKIVMGYIRPRRAPKMAQVAKPQ